MFESKSPAVIVLDAARENVHFYARDTEDRGIFHHDVENYKASSLDDEFFEKFSHILKFYKESTPTAALDKAILVLPNNTVCTDIFTIPYVRKSLANNSVALAISSIYDNSEQIKFSTYPILQNKQNLTYGAVGIRRDLLSKFRSICNENQVSLDAISFVSNTAVNAALAINSKLRNATFMLMDIKNDHTVITFVLKGKTAAFFELPFGYSVLLPDYVHTEDSLFDHSVADLLVVNAKQRARAKQLKSQLDYAPINEEEVFVKEAVRQDTDADDDEEVVEPVESDDSNANLVKIGVARRQGRKLPKYMLRPVPEKGNAAIYENFRVFVKWALDLINSNSTLLSYGNLDTVYVNMPEQFEFLYDVVNEKAEDNKVTFAPLTTDYEKHSDALQNLEIYGASYLKQFNKINNF